MWKQDTACNFIIMRKKFILKGLNRHLNIMNNTYIPITLYGVEETSQIFLRDIHILPKLAMRNTADVTGGKPIVI
jgi:hypothetical protein